MKFLWNPITSIYYQFSSVTPVIGSQTLLAIAAGLQRLQVINSSASSLFALPFSTSFRDFLHLFLFFFFVLLPATRSILAYAISYRPRVIHALELSMSFSSILTVVIPTFSFFLSLLHSPSRDLKLVQNICSVLLPLLPACKLLAERTKHG